MLFNSLYLLTALKMKRAGSHTDLCSLVAQCLKKVHSIVSGGLQVVKWSFLSVKFVQ